MSYTFTDLPTVSNIRNTSRICVTYFNISWDPPSITCGDVYYDVLISQPPIGGGTVAITVDSFLSVTGLNNSLPNVTIIVTAIDRVGQERCFQCNFQNHWVSLVCTVVLKYFVSKKFSWAMKSTKLFTRKFLT